MSAAITLEELLVWNDEAASFWKGHFEANPALLDLPCGIGGTGNVQGFVRHIWGAELRLAQRLAGVPVITREDVPDGPLPALYDLHLRANEILGPLLSDPPERWQEIYVLDVPWIPVEARNVSRRKVATHMLFHSHRHWAQLATLLRQAGFPAPFKGDLLFSSALA
jgi:hypothetical protein